LDGPINGLRTVASSVIGLLHLGQSSPSFANSTSGSWQANAGFGNFGGAGFGNDFGTGFGFGAGRIVYYVYSNLGFGPVSDFRGYAKPNQTKQLASAFFSLLRASLILL